MTEVFADASLFIALIDRDDDYHEQAAEFLHRNRALMITTSAIVLELGAFYSASHLRPGFLACLAAMTRAKIEIVHVSSALQQRGIALFEKRPDKNWSLADCISFEVMRDRGVAEAATTDEHFEQAGFVAVLRAPKGEGRE